jgi:putative hydrolase of the HAD superfamily
MKPQILQGIRNIIFDLGGVIINLDYWITINHLSSLGLKDADRIYSQVHQLPWFDQFDTGGISADEFIRELLKMLDPGVSRQQVIDAWNSMLLDFPKERADLLLGLKKHYRTFLLSNTNELHLNYYLPLIQEWYGSKGIHQFFEKEYYSHIIRIRKPDVSVFQLIINENGLNPAETLFIDDTYQHVEGARNSGINAYHLAPPETIKDLFKDYS